MSERENPKPLFILVHGTFAPHAPWTRDDSKISQRLLREFPDVEIAQFNWSGKNNHEARLAAGKAFAKYINEKCAFGDRKVTIIAHSHGGNVLLIALRDALCAKSADSIVFLGTPFFHVSDRQPGLVITKLARLNLIWASLAAFALGGIAGIFLQYYAAPYIAAALFLAFNADPHRSIAPVILAILLCLALSVLFGKMVAKLLLWALSEALAGILTDFWINSARMKRATERWLRQPEPNCRCLVMYTPRDEARMTLSSVAFLADFGWNTQKLFWASLSWTWGMFCMLILIFIGPPDNREMDEQGQSLLVGFVVYSAVGIAFLYGGRYFSEWLSELLRRQKFGFGKSKYPKTSRYIRIHASKFPRFATSSNVTLTKLKFRRGGLHHSAFYSDPDAIDELINWLRYKPIANKTLMLNEIENDPVYLEQMTMHPVPAVFGSIVGIVLSFPIWTWPVNISGTLVAITSVTVSGIIFYFRSRSIRRSRQSL